MKSSQPIHIGSNVTVVVGLVDFVEFLLRERFAERWLNGDGIDVGQHFLDHIGIERVECEAIAKNQMIWMLMLQ